MSTPEAAQPASSPYLTVIGESLVDIIDDPHRASVTSQTHPGGSPLNVAVGTARLDLPTTLVTHYGEDPHGRDRLHELIPDQLQALAAYANRAAAITCSRLAHILRGRPNSAPDRTDAPDRASKLDNTTDIRSGPRRKFTCPKAREAGPLLPVEPGNKRSDAPL